MKTLSTFLLFLVLAATASAQEIFLGPLNQPPIDPSSCVPDSKFNQTGMCFTNNGIYISISGQPFVGPLPLKGDPGQAATITVGTTTTLPSGTPATVTNSGTSSQAILNFGIPAGPPGNGLASGTILNVTISCPKGTGTIGNGFKSPNSGACQITVQ